MARSAAGRKELTATKELGTSVLHPPAHLQHLFIFPMDTLSP